MNSKFLTESARISFAYENIINESSNDVDKMCPGLKNPSLVYTEIKKSPYDKNKISKIFQNKNKISLPHNTIGGISNKLDDKIVNSKSKESTIQNDNTSANTVSNSLQSDATTEIKQNEIIDPDNTEFSGEEEDYILGKSEKRPSTLDPNVSREELRNRYYPNNESVDENDDGEEEVVKTIVGPKPTAVNKEDYKDKVSEYFSSTASFEQKRNRNIFFDDEEMKLWTDDEQWKEYLPRICSQLAFSLNRRHNIKINWDVKDDGCYISIESVNESVENKVSNETDIMEAIATVSDIAAKHNAKIGRKYNGRDEDFIYLTLIINDPDKTVGVGFNMNYIMSIGRAIEEDMKEAGINGFVGAGGYIGCSTSVQINKKLPFNQSENILKESTEDSSEYKCFVIVNYGGEWKIDSGWEFKEDAVERTKDGEIPKTEGCQIKIVGCKTLSKFNLDANNDEDWQKGIPDDKQVITEKSMFDSATGFYDKPRSTKEIAEEFNSIDKERIIGFDDEESPIYAHYDEKTNTLWADGGIKMKFERDRSMDYNLQKLSEIVEETK